MNSARIYSVCVFVTIFFAASACDFQRLKDNEILESDTTAKPAVSTDVQINLSGNLIDLEASALAQQLYPGSGKVGSNLTQAPRRNVAALGATSSRTSADSRNNALPTTRIAITAAHNAEFYAGRTGDLIGTVPITSGRIGGPIFIPRAFQSQSLRVVITRVGSNVIATEFELPPLTMRSSARDFELDILTRANGSAVTEVFQLDSAGNQISSAPRITVDNGFDNDGDGVPDIVARMDFNDGTSIIDADLDGNFGESGDRIDLNGDGVISPGEASIFVDFDLDGTSDVRVLAGELIEDGIDEVEASASPSSIVANGGSTSVTVRFKGVEGSCPIGALATLSLSGGTFAYNRASSLTRTLEGAGVQVEAGGTISVTETILAPEEVGEGRITLTAIVARTADVLVESLSITVRENEGPIIDTLATVTGSLSSPIGSDVAVRGRNFGTDPLSVFVTFGGAVADVSSIRDDEILVQIPADAQTGAVSVIKGEEIASTAQDFTILPGVAAVAPADLSTGVPSQTRVALTFSEPISGIDTSTLIVKTLAGAEVSGTVSPTGEASTFTFTPDSTFAENTVFVVSVETVAFQSSFETGSTPDSTAPTIESVSPALAETGVGAGSAITVTFSEPVNSGSVEGAVSVVASEVSVSGKTTLSPDGLVVTFTPIKSTLTSTGFEFGGLLGGTEYTISVSTSVTDIAGINLAQTFTSTFNTGIWVSHLSTYSGTSESEVTAFGGGFGSAFSDNVVRCAGTTATILSSSANSLTFSYPQGAASGDVVISAGGNTSNGLPFTVTALLDIVGTATVGGIPSQLAIRPGSTLGVVSDESQGKLIEFDSSTGAATGRSLELRGLATDLLYSSDGSKLYACNFGPASKAGERVYIIDAEKLTLLGNVRVGRRPVRMALSAGGSRLFVSNYQDNTICVIDTAKREVEEYLRTDAGPNGIGITPDGAKGYACNYLEGTVTVFSAVNLTTTTTINVGDGPARAIVSPDGRWVLVTNHGSGSLSVIDATKDIVAKTIALGIQPVGVSFDPSGTKAFVTLKGQNAVRVLEISSTSVTLKSTGISAGSAPSGIAVTEDGTRLIVSNRGDATVRTTFISDVAPTISALSRNSGVEGEIIDIYGTSFAFEESNNEVNLGGTTLSLVSASSQARLRVQIPTGAKSGPITVRSRGLTSNPVYFTVSAERPTVVGVIPFSGATNVAQDKVVTALFDQSVDPDSVTSASFFVADATGDEALGSIEMLSENTGVKFTPSESYKPGTLYTISVLPFVLGRSGNSLDGDPVAPGLNAFTSTFRTTERVFVIPTIAGFSPTSSEGAGGGTLTISGTNFVQPSGNSAGTKVFFGTRELTGLSFASTTGITATIPISPQALVPGTAPLGVNLRVVNPDGQQSAATEQFKYIPANVPFTILGVSPASGPAAGGTSVTLTGTGFAEGMTISVGGTAASGVTVLSSTSATAVTPSSSAASSNSITAVSVGATLEAKSASLPLAFRYTPAPVFTSIAPSSFPVTGGLATIFGNFFGSGAKVLVDGTEVSFGTDQALGVKSASEITVLLPPRIAGVKTIAIRNPDGQTTAGRTVTYEAATADVNMSIQSAMPVALLGVPATNSASVTFSGNTAKGLTVELVSSGSVLETTTSGNIVGAFTFTHVFTEGTHTLGARALSSGTVIAESAPIIFIVDLTAPPAPSLVTLAAGSDSGSSNADGITNVTMPTINVTASDFGTAPAGGSITVIASNGVADIGQTTLSGSSGSVTLTSALADGSNQVLVRAVDAVGNASESVALVIDVDTVSPNAPTIALAPASDSGDSASDGITNDGTPALEGTAEAASTISVSDTGATISGQTSVGALGDFSLTLTSIADGSYSVSATATDVAGNASVSSNSFSLTIDTIAPTGTSVTINSGGAITNNASVSVALTATGASGMQIAYDGTADTESFVVFASTDSGTLSPASTGTRTVSAKFRDVAGNVSSQVTDAIVLDLTAPSDPALTLMDMTTSSQSITNSVAINVSVNEESGIAMWLISESQSTQPLASNVAWSTEPMTFALSSADGVKTVYIWVMDSAGNVNVGPVSQTITLDLTPPRNPILLLSDQTTADVNNTNAIVVDVAISGDTDAAMWLVAESASSQPAETDAGWTSTKPTTFTLSSGDGAKTVFCWTKDIAGNVNSAASSTTVTLDTVAPVDPSPSLSDATSGETSATNDTLVNLIVSNDAEAVMWIASESQSTQPAENDLAWTGTEPTSVTISSGDGLKTIYVWVKDASGNVNAGPTDARIALDTVAPGDPTLTLQDPNTASASLTNQTTVDAIIGGDTGSSHWFLSESQSSQPGELDPGFVSVRPTTFGLSSTDGVKGVYIWIKDIAGNVCANPGTASITLDQTPPATANLAISDQTSASASYTNSLAIDANITGDTDAVEWLVSETAATTPALSDPDWVTSQPTTFTLSSGDALKTVYLWTKDVANNISASVVSQAITLDTSAPFAPSSFTLDAGAAYTSSASVTADITFSGGESQMIISESHSVQPGEADGSWQTTSTSFPFTLSGGDGLKTVYLWVMDDAGNVAASSNSASITLDTVAPTVTAPNILAVISTDGGTANVAGVGDVITVTWDSISDGNSDAYDAVCDMSSYGGGISVAMFDDGTNGDATPADGIFTAEFVVVAGSVDDAAAGTSVTANDFALNGSGVVADDGTLSVDSEEPAVNVATEVNHSITSDAAPFGVLSISEILNVQVDTTAYADITSVAVDFSAISGSSAQALFDDGTNGDASPGDGVYTYERTTTAGSEDGNTYFLSVRLIDDAGNVYGFTADDVALDVDNVAPVVSALDLSAAISVDNNSDSVAATGDAILVTYNAGSQTDITSVEGDLSAFEGSATQALFDDGTNGDATPADGIWSYEMTVVAGAVDSTGLTWSATILDDANNSGSSSDDDTVDIDSEPPSLSAASSAGVRGSWTGNSGGTTGTINSGFLNLDVDGTGAQDVFFSSSGGSGAAVAGDLQAAINDLGAELAGVLVSELGGGQYKIESGTTGTASSVTVNNPGDSAGYFEGSPYPDTNAISNVYFIIDADGAGAQSISFSSSGGSAAVVASDIEAAIQSAGGALSLVTVADDIDHYVVTSGTTGASSSVLIYSNGPTAGYFSGAGAASSSATSNAKIVLDIDGSGPTDLLYSFGGGTADDLVTALQTAIDATGGNLAGVVVSQVAGTIIFTSPTTGVGSSVALGSSAPGSGYSLANTGGATSITSGVDDQISVEIDGAGPYELTLGSQGNVASIVAALQSQIDSFFGAGAGLASDAGGGQIRIDSLTSGSTSYVTVTAGTNDGSAALALGLANGGTEETGFDDGASGSLSNLTSGTQTDGEDDALPLIGFDTGASVSGADDASVTLNLVGGSPAAGSAPSGFHTELINYVYGDINTVNPGDKIKVIFDATGIPDIASATIDLAAIGGSGTQALFDDGSNGDWASADGIYTFEYVVPAGTLDVSGASVDLTVTDDAGNSDTLGDDDTLSIDVLAPDVTTANITTSITIDTGAPGVLNLGDVLRIEWNSGEASTETLFAWTNLLPFEGNSAETLYDDGTNGDTTSGDGIWTYEFTISAGVTDSVSNQVTVSAKDNALNKVADVADDVAYDLDNVAPLLNPSAISTVISTDNGTPGIAGIGDVISVVWDTNGQIDLASVTVDLSAFEGSAADVMFDDGAHGDGGPADGVWGVDFTVTAGATDSTGLGVSISTTDDAGNSDTVADDDTVDLDNIALPLDATMITSSMPTDNGTPGVAGVGDVIRCEYNPAVAPSEIAAAEADFSAFGGSANVAMFDDGVTGGDTSSGDGIWTVEYTVVVGAIDDVDQGVTVTATDDAGNVTGPVADDDTVDIDNEAPAPSNSAVTLTIEVDSGALGTAGVGDVIKAMWDSNTDAVTDVATAETDFSAFDGPANLSLTDDGAGYDFAPGDGIFTGSWTVTAGTTDSTGFSTGLTVIDDAGNTGFLSDDDTIDVDNVAPLPTDARIFVTISTDLGTAGIAGISDVIEVLWDGSASGDNIPDIQSVTADLSAFGGLGAQDLYDDGSNGDVSPGDGMFTYQYTVVAGLEEALNQNVTVTVTDDAGNQSAPVADTTDVDIDDVAPVVLIAQPNGGETLFVNSTYSVQWTTSDGFPSLADIDYSADSGLSWVAVTSAETDDGDYGWFVPNNPTVLGRVRITATDTAGNIGSAVVSAADFTIEYPARIFAIVPVNADGTYSVGTTLDIEVRFDKAVTVSGNPYLDLNIGGPKQANYVSGSGTKKLLFRYYVQQGDAGSDIDVLGSFALNLNGGTIQGPSSETADIGTTAFGFASQRTISVDTNGWAGGFILQGNPSAAQVTATINAGFDNSLADASYSLASGDVDDDGDIDIVVANFFDYQRVYLNNGAGGFIVQTVDVGSNLLGAHVPGFDVAGVGSSSDIALGDVDGDYDLDCVVANHAGEQQFVYLNNGVGGFVLQANDTAANLGTTLAGFDTAGAGDSLGIALGDVDGDGDLDVVVANDNDGQQDLYLNNGVGGFILQTNDTAANLGTSAAGFDNSGIGYSYDIKLGDVDGDGDLDAVVANNGAEQYVYLNNSVGGFILQVNDTAANLGATGAGFDTALTGNTHGIALGDIDGDGDLDAVVANSLSAEQNVYLNNGAGGFILVANDTAANLGTTLAGFDTAGTGSSESIRLGDVDEDGDLDAIVTNNGAAPMVYLNNGVGGFLLQANDTAANLGISNSGFDLGGTTTGWETSFEDFDGDGDKDVAVAVNGSVEEIFLNNGVGGFILQTNDTAINLGERKRGVDIAATPYAQGMAFADMDLDGDLDFVVANNSANENTILLNNGYGGFVLAANDTAANLGVALPGFDTAGTDEARDVALGDVDGDGDVDAVMACFSAPQSLYLNNGVGGMILSPPDTAGNISAGGTGFDNGINDKGTGIALGDLDGDGDLDCVVACEGEENRVFLNLGNGGFLRATNDSAANLGAVSAGFDIAGGMLNGTCVALGDVDGDNDLDAIFGNYTAAPDIYLNNGVGGFIFAPSDTAANIGTTNPGFDNADTTSDFNSVQLADVDGDGNLDAIFGLGGVAPGYVYLGNGAGGFIMQTNDTAANLGTTLAGFDVAGGAATSEALLGDYDGDGDLDCILVNNDGPTELYFNNGAGGFIYQPNDTAANIGQSGTGIDDYTGASGMASAVCDVDKDGDLDFAVATGFGGVVELYLNNFASDRRYSLRIAIDVPDGTNIGGGNTGDGTDADLGMGAEIRIWRGANIPTDTNSVWVLPASSSQLARGVRIDNAPLALTFSKADVDQLSSGGGDASDDLYCEVTWYFDDAPTISNIYRLSKPGGVGLTELNLRQGRGTLVILHADGTSSLDDRTQDGAPLDPVTFDSTP
ncbi:MAG: FG-GAP-like repeat-containing protein [Planctomycetes bacterium]|nr:FG-GAP-like repeat-containing protein [Planctomycetota bacterium]